MFTETRASSAVVADPGKKTRPHHQRIALGIAAAGVAVATVSACTPGQAVLGLGTVTTHPITVTPIQRYTAPTANLTKLANALVMKHKSVTTQVTAPAHLNLTGPVTIKVQASGVAQHAYDNSGGNSFVANVPENNGLIYDDNVAITLTETLPNNQTTSFAITWRASIEPLYNVDIGTLTFFPTDTCTVGAKSQYLKLYWRDPDNRIDIDATGMQWQPAVATLPLGYVFQLPQFARHYNEVGQRTGALIKPQVAWIDANSPAAVSWPSTAQSLVVGSNQGYWTELLSESNGEGCHVIYRYPITKTLLTYPSL